MKIIKHKTNNENPLGKFPIVDRHANTQLFNIADFPLVLEKNTVSSIDYHMMQLAYI